MMNRYYDYHFDKQIVTIYPGEFFATFGDELIYTVLGSCISITLFDEKNKFGGMNHFMFANTNKDGLADDGLQGRYGEYAIKLLLEELLKHGADRKSLTAKVFGGSNVFNLPPDAGIQVGDMNIKFAFDYLKKEQIPVVASDIAGIYPRKIFFDPHTSKVWLKRIRTKNEDSSLFLQKEQNYLLSSAKDNEKIKSIFTVKLPKFDVAEAKK